MVTVFSPAVSLGQLPRAPHRFRFRIAILPELFNMLKSTTCFLHIIRLPPATKVCWRWTRIKDNYPTADVKALYFSDWRTYHRKGRGTFTNKAPPTNPVCKENLLRKKQVSLGRNNVLWLRWGLVVQLFCCGCILQKSKNPWPPKVRKAMWKDKILL